MLNQKTLNRCLKLSRTLFHLPVSRKKHFSFIIARKKIIVGFGVNNGFRTHPLSFKLGCRYNATHAELAAIKNIDFSPAKLSDMFMVNIRLKLDKSLGVSKPCEGCSKLLDSFGLPCYYLSENGIWELREC